MLKFFTADKDKPTASTLAVKDGSFVYVGEYVKRVGKTDSKGLFHSERMRAFMRHISSPKVPVKTVHIFHPKYHTS